MILKDRRKLARLMVVMDVTQRDLAAAAGYSAHSMIGRLLRGEIDSLGTDPALRIAHHLRVAVEDLFLPGPTRNSGRYGQVALERAAHRDAKRTGQVHGEPS